MKKVIVRLRSLLKDTQGNGEVVGVLVAVGIAVTLGLAAITLIGKSSKTSAQQQGTSIEALPH